MLRTAACIGSLGVASGTVYFQETFGEGWESRWTLNKAKSTQGAFVAATGKYFRDEKEDVGIQTSEDSKFFTIATSFDSFSNDGKDLIIQYQAKYEKDIECGGGYLKIGPKLEDLTTFGNPTPYNIMFGPDKCGSEKRTHLIFSYEGENILKTSELPYKQEGDATSHLYRMTLKPDSTVTVEIDEENIYSGSIEEDWEILEAKEIEDPDDNKPPDWVDEAMVDDWVVKKPADWVDAHNARIPDPDSEKPDDWVDAEDGIWSTPMIDNPGWKGEWIPKRVSNPAYKGSWEQKMIANPEYVADDALYRYADFGFIGFDLWQVKGGTIFDNIILTDDKAEADAFAKKWKDLNEVEKSKKQDDEKWGIEKTDDKEDKKDKKIKVVKNDKKDNKIKEL